MTKIFLRSALVIAISILVIGFASYAVYQVFFAFDSEVPVRVIKEPTITSPVPEFTAPIEIEAVSFIRPTPEVLPRGVRKWVENSLKFDMTCFANAMELDGKQYLFVAGGARGFVDNYLVEITDVVIVGQEEVVVKAKFTRLSPGQAAPDNPYDLVYIKATGLPVRFVPLADEAIFITSLTGIHYLPDIVAQSRTIKVFSPSAHEIVGDKFSVSGVANTFEATFHYRLLDANQNILVGDFGTAAQLAPSFTREPVLPHSQMPWRYFAFDLTVPETIVADADLTLELYWSSPKDGAIEDLIVIPLKFELR